MRIRRELDLSVNNGAENKRRNPKQFLQRHAFDKLLRICTDVILEISNETSYKTIFGIIIIDPTKEYPSNQKIETRNKQLSSLQLYRDGLE